MKRRIFLVAMVAAMACGDAMGQYYNPYYYYQQQMNQGAYSLGQGIGSLIQGRRQKKQEALRRQQEEAEQQRQAEEQRRKQEERQRQAEERRRQQEADGSCVQLSMNGYVPAGYCKALLSLNYYVGYERFSGVFLRVKDDGDCSISNIISLIQRKTNGKKEALMSYVVFLSDGSIYSIEAGNVVIREDNAIVINLGTLDNHQKLLTQDITAISFGGLEYTATLDDGIDSFHSAVVLSEMLEKGREESK